MVFWLIVILLVLILGALISIALLLHEQTNGICLEIGKLRIATIKAADFSTDRLEEIRSAVGGKREVRIVQFSETLD